MENPQDNKGHKTTYTCPLRLGVPTNAGCHLLVLVVFHVKLQISFNYNRTINLHVTAKYQSQIQ